MPCQCVMRKRLKISVSELGQNFLVPETTCPMLLTLPSNVQPLLLSLSNVQAQYPLHLLFFSVFFCVFLQWTAIAAAATTTTKEDTLAEYSNMQTTLLWGYYLPDSW